MLLTDKRVACLNLQIITAIYLVYQALETYPQRQMLSLGSMRETHKFHVVSTKTFISNAASAISIAQEFRKLYASFLGKAFRFINGDLVRQSLEF